MRSSPAVGGETHPTIRIVEDLPAPLGPRKPNASPRRTSTSIPSTAVNSPNRLVSPRARISTSAAAGPAAAPAAAVATGAPFVRLRHDARTSRRPARRTRTLSRVTHARQRRPRRPRAGLLAAPAPLRGTSRSAARANHTSRGSSPASSACAAVRWPRAPTTWSRTRVRPCAGAELAVHEGPELAHPHPSSIARDRRTARGAPGSSAAGGVEPPGRRPRAPTGRCVGGRGENRGMP